MTRLLGAVAIVLGVCVTLAAASPAAARAEGRLLFVGTYTNEKSQGIYAFRFDDRAGTLTPIGLAVATPSPSFIIASADGRFVFAVNELSTYEGQPSGSVTSFKVDPAAGTLTPISTQASKGTSPCHLALDRTGRFLVVANYSSGTIAVFPVGADGALSPAVEVIADQGKGPNASRQEGPHAHEVVFSRDNRYLIAIDLGTDHLEVFRFNEATGVVTANTPTGIRLTPGAGPRHIAFHPDERHAFVISEMASTITSVSWDRGAGLFTAPGTPVSTLPADFHGTSTAAEIAVHPNGRFVYGSNRGGDRIAIFEIGPTGALAPKGFVSTRGKTPRHFAIAPGGQWLIAANQDSGTLAVFRIDTTTGALAPQGDLVDAGTPVCVLFL